jgi:hypothetical protein
VIGEVGIVLEDGRLARAAEQLLNLRKDIRS